MAEEKRNEAAVAAPEVNLSDVIRVRHEKLAALREAGTDPFQITKYPQNAYSAEIKERFTDLAAEEKERHLQQTLIGIKRKYGKNSILKAISYTEKCTARMRNKLVGGHNGGEI